MGRPGRESNISEVGPRAPITDSGLRYLWATGVFVPTRGRGSNQIRNRGAMVYAYANNHHAGHAPATIETFQDLWRRACRNSESHCEFVRRNRFCSSD
jgi:hypothetical protein